MNYHIQELTEPDIARWDGYVTAHPDSSIYHLSLWRDLIQRLFGHSSLYLYAEDDAGAIRGVLPLVQIKSRLFGHYMVSMPYFNYGGSLSDQVSVSRELMMHAVAKAANSGVEHIEFRDTVVEYKNWPVRNDKITMVLSLPGSIDELWKALGSKLRSQIKRPQRENPEVHIGGVELLDDFYRVFAVNMRDLGTPVYPKQFFWAILEQLPDRANIISVRLNNEPVGGGFLLGFGGMLEIPWASTLRKVNHLSINMLMYWEVLKFAVGHGYMAFDFGRCTEGSGTHRFKKQWGTQPRQLNWHYWLRDSDKLPGLTPDNPKYHFAISVWKKMPIVLTNAIGPHIVKNLP